jgi:hypothetical protein
MKIKKNGKVINLTESDLRRIVKKVIKEQDEAPVADATTGEKTSWEFPFKPGGDSNVKLPGTVLIAMTQMKDPKTGKKKSPSYTVYVKNKEGRVIAGNLYSNGKWKSSGGDRKFLRLVGGCTNEKCDGTNPDVVNAMKKGFQGSIGVTPPLV